MSKLRPIANGIVLPLLIIIFEFCKYLSADTTDIEMEAKRNHEPRGGEGIGGWRRTKKR